MRVVCIDGSRSPLFIEQREWLSIMDTIDIIYDVLDKTKRDSLRYGYGKELGYPEVDKLATALEQFIEDNREMERVEIDCFHAVEVKCVKNFIRFIRLAQRIKVL